MGLGGCALPDSGEMLHYENVLRLMVSICTSWSGVGASDKCRIAFVVLVASRYQTGALMTIRYTLTPEVLRRGAHRHDWYRLKALRIVGLVSSIFLITMGSASFLIVGQEPLLNGFLVSFGMVLLLRGSLRSRRIARAAFKGRGNSIQVKMELGDERIFVTTEDSQSSMKWSSFVDRKTFEDGILIYPQKNLFNWIPANATIEGGNWDELRKEIDTRISLKV